MAIPISFRRQFAFKKRMLMTKPIAPQVTGLEKYILFSNEMSQQWRQEFADKNLLSPRGYHHAQVQSHLTQQAEACQREMDNLDPLNPDYRALSFFPKPLRAVNGKLPLSNDNLNLFSLGGAFRFSAWAICHCLLPQKQEAMFQVHRIFYELSRLPGFIPFASDIWQEDAEYQDTSILRVNNSNWWNMMLAAYACAQDIYALGLVPEHEHQAIIEMFQAWARLMAINFCSRSYDGPFTRLGNRGIHYDAFIIPEREPEDYIDARIDLGIKYKPYIEFPGDLQALNRYMSNRRGMAALAALKMYFFIRNHPATHGAEPLLEAIRNSVRNFYKNTVAFGILNDEANGIDSVFFELYRSHNDKPVRKGFNYTFINFGLMSEIAYLFALHDKDTSLVHYQTRVQTRTSGMGFYEVERPKSLWKAVATLDKMQRGEIVVRKPYSSNSLPMDGGSQDQGGGNIYQWLMASALSYLKYEDPDNYELLKGMIYTDPAYPFTRLNWDGSPYTVMWGQLNGLFQFPGIPASFYLSVVDTPANPFRPAS